jgi:hypothetical protein
VTPFGEVRDAAAADVAPSDPPLMHVDSAAADGADISRRGGGLGGRPDFDGVAGALSLSFDFGFAEEGKGTLKYPRFSSLLAS